MCNMMKRLKTLYPDSYKETFEEIRRIIEEYKSKNPKNSINEKTINQDYKDSKDNNSSNNNKNDRKLFSEKDIVLICYADHVSEEGVKTLKTMKNFLEIYVKGYINKIHFLPFYPYSSDDGFSVIDYYKVKEEFGDWEDIKSIGKEFGLMFDAVINHISQRSEWFKNYLEGNTEYENYFIGYDTEVNTESVFRPRTHPLLTKFSTKMGDKFVWTTFSDDQIDLNFKEPKVLIEFVKILLFYFENCSEVIRLDAIAFLWKELDTKCLHMPQVHTVVKIFREIFNEIRPKGCIITETNVAHKDNISYYGSGNDEAHLVYNFTLPPLLLISFLEGNAKRLSEWASTLEINSEETAFFNFTASHDGIGVTPLKGIVSDEEIKKLAEHIISTGGKVNFRSIPGQEPFPYELNTVYLSAMDTPEKFLCSQAIQLSLQGVPAIYFNSLIGAENWKEGAQKLGYNRAINLSLEISNSSWFESLLWSPLALKKYSSSFSHF